MLQFRLWATAILLAASLFSLFGCSSERITPTVFVRSETRDIHATTGDSRAISWASPPAIPTPSAREKGPPEIRIISPADGEAVATTGSVRFYLEGTIPPGSKPVLFIQDATGLDTNWWCYRPREAGSREFHASVQYGLPLDHGPFHLVVLLLGEASCPKQGSVGPLPEVPLATSSLVEVVRD